MKRLRKRICGACILFLMMILAAGTMVSFAEERSTSYKLIIQKIFAPDTLQDVKDQAQNMTYTFRVEAEVKGSKDPVEKTVRITGEGSEEISFDNTFKISVIEQTDDGGFTDADNAEWDVTNTYCESSMHVSASQATVNISKDDGKGTIKVSRPEGVPTVTFQLTGKPFHSENPISISPSTKIVKAGESAEWTNLPQGEYTIAKLRSADGFTVHVGEREFNVPAGGIEEVHINGSDSRISITAPSAASGEPRRTHHYSISTDSETIIREIDLYSGETGVVEHLTEGNYKIKVSRTYGGISGYTVTLPQTTYVGKIGTIKTISTTSKTSRTVFTVGGDYIGNLAYGPLQDASGNTLSNATYQFYYGAINPEDTSKTLGWSTSVTKGGVTRNPVSLTGTEKAIVREPYNKKLYLGTKNVSSSKAAQLKVYWREYTIAEPSDMTISDPDPEGDVVTIDSRGWFTITKQEDTSDPRSGDVLYHYTITDANGNPPVTDENGNAVNLSITAKDAAGKPIDDVTVNGSTITMKAGRSVTISGLHAGNFRIYEEDATSAPAMGFYVKLEDTEKRVTAPGGIIEIETKDERTVEISRPGTEADDGGRLYTYEIYEADKAEPVRTITLKSGETKTVAEATDGTKLPAGKYRIEAVDDQIVGFDVTYSDSSSLTSDYICNASVNFTNTFGIVNASYHVIHEYYLRYKDADGNYKYEFEGASPVYTKNCDGKDKVSPDAKCQHLSSEVHQLDVYNGNTYQHIEHDGDAYGKVVSWDTGGEQKTVPLDPGDRVPENPYPFIINGTGRSGSDESGYIKHEYAYVPLTNLDYAEALPHEETDGHAAQIIILRYYREDTEEHGKYNIIHEYYRRTKDGDVWEGSSDLSTIDVGRLTNENRYHTYDANGVTPILHFTATKGNAAGTEYPYVYDSAAYGRIVSSDNSIPADKPGDLGGSKVYLTDSTMNSVQATEAGNQIIILRYYRGGGYKVVHEYYYREAANFEGDTGETESGSDETEGDSGETEGDSGETANAQGTRTAYSENNIQNQDTVSGNTPPGTTDIIDDTLPDAVVLSAAPPPEGTDSGADTVQSLKNSVSNNNPQDTVQPPENSVSGNNPPDTSGADVSQSRNETAEMPEENAELEAYGIMALDEESGEENSFNGTLTDEPGYVYAFEGKRDIASYSAKLESKHDAGGVAKENSFQPADDEKHLYVFKDAVYGYIDDSNPDTYRVAPYMTGVTATSAEDEIIILRYIRGEGVEEPQPTPPENPSGGGGGSNPPPEDPEISEFPDLPTELPDPNDPDSPDRITILEGGVPKTYVKVWDFDKQEWVYIPEEDVPLWKTSPQTADGNMPGFWLVLAAVSAGGFVLLRSAPGKKR